jgi:hypothetical protein
LGFEAQSQQNRIVYHEGGRMSIKAFGKTVPKEAFREVRVLDKT